MASYRAGEGYLDDEFLIRDDLAALNVHFDVFFSERSLIEGKRDEVGATIDNLRKVAAYMKAICRRQGRRSLRIGKIVSRHCFGQPISATMWTARWKLRWELPYFAAPISSLSSSKVTRGFQSLVNMSGR